MSLPAGWTPLDLDGVRGLPQSAPLPAGVLRAVLVGVAPDLAALLSVAPDRPLWSSADALARRPRAGSGAPQDTWLLARDTAVAALTAPPGDTLSAAQVLTAVLVVSGSRLLACWPPVPGRPLPVGDGGTLLGHLWVDEVTVRAGSLVAPGPVGSRFALGWRPLSPAATTVTAPGPATQEDLYAALV